MVTQEFEISSGAIHPDANRNSQHGNETNRQWPMERRHGHGGSREITLDIRAQEIFLSIDTALP